jgi:predicted RecB family nuclease
LENLPQSVRPDPKGDTELALWRRERGTEFEREVGEVLKALHPDIVLVSDGTSPDQTVAAMDAGALLIWNASLPADVVNRRSGKPDLLVRHGDSPQGGNWRYVPVDVKRHKPFEDGPVPKQIDIVNGSLGTLATNEGVPTKGVPNGKDNLQLSHYWSILETLDRAPQGINPTGGIIGRAESKPHLIWFPLDIDDYTVKFGQALTIIDHATTVTESTLTNTSARTFKHDECKTCKWIDSCRPQWEARKDLELVVTETQAEDLRTEGISNLTELAQRDISLQQNKTGVTLTLRARAKIRGLTAIVRPNANDPANEIPAADIEIDVDMENSDDHCYLWGTYTTIHSTTRPQGLEEGYKHFACFEEDGKTFALDTPSNEESTFKAFWGWMQGLILECEQLGLSIAFYGYALPNAENPQLRRAAERYAGNEEIPSIEEVSKFIAADSPMWIDIYPRTKRIWATPEGEGVKPIARHCGHAWQDKGDGGEASLMWFDEATHSSDPDQRLKRSEQLLEYNENDVVATKVIRDFLRSNWPFADVEPPTFA